MKEIPEKIDSKFRYVLLSATRCEQLMRGAHPKLDHAGKKLTRLAMNEVMSDTVGWEYGPAPAEGEAGSDEEARG
jgi:DNA-directed RNA polymerase subunit K/omega